MVTVAGCQNPHKSGVVKRRRRAGAAGAVSVTRAAQGGPRCAGGAARSERRIVERQLGLREAILAVVLEQGRFVSNWAQVRTRQMDWTGLKLLLEGIEPVRYKRRFRLPTNAVQPA